MALALTLTFCRRAEPGRFGSLGLAKKNRHFGGVCSWMLAGKARKCGRFWVFACVPNPGKQSIWRQCASSTRKESTKKLPNRPGFTHVQTYTLYFLNLECSPSGPRGNNFKLSSANDFLAAGCPWRGSLLVIPLSAKQ